VEEEEEEEKEKEEEDFLNQCKRELKRHAHTMSGEETRNTESRAAGRCCAGASAQEGAAAVESRC